MDGAAEAGQAQRGAGLGEGREGGGVAADVRGEEGARVEAEAVGVGARCGGELDQAVPVVQGGRRRGGVAHAGRMVEWRACVSRLAYANQNALWSLEGIVVALDLHLKAGTLSFKKKKKKAGAKKFQNIDHFDFIILSNHSNRFSMSKNR